MNSFGPHLKLWSSSHDEWEISVLYGKIGEAPPSFSYKLPSEGSYQLAEMELLETRGELTYFRVRFEVPLRASHTRVDYKVGGKRYSFHVPELHRMPKVCYGSCNGFHSQKILKEFVEGGKGNAMKATERWRNMLQYHSSRRYNVCILGGDQIYSDIALEGFEDHVLKWSWHTTRSERKARSLTAGEVEALRDLYTDMYVNSWGRNPEMKKMLSTCPSLMMWDDHDIMDGWGSYEDEREKWPVFKEGVFPEARRAFLLFQHHCKPNEKPGGSLGTRNNFSTGHVMGSLGVVHLDTRSERTQHQVMSEKNWEKFAQWRESNTELKHLFLCVSVPMVYADFETIEKILRLIPFDQGIEDDLRDHWRSVPHQVCRERLLKDLFAYSKESACRVTIISGDVHVAAHGVVELKDGQGDHTRTNRIHQLISSPIMNKAGNPVVEKLVEWQGDAAEVINPTMSARMLPLQVAIGTNGASSKTARYVWERNWLSLLPQDDDAYRAEWYFEGSNYPCREIVYSV
ncbi:alkaline phosphatase D family protein [Coraliomargarita algicola]|uniref:Alkaline phosphatase D family protein n=1 Tax=Coraliomargarita algicola TaxID=3092156 RepID=A0ABZ0RR47_9BACT|nr:alkaline phosphatase D family protein [Coraliomargarita sp. J2-16]WPJ97450.1 alkaline phosphatase D family protein [Coraliomargarita sp. J2-16]